MYRHTPIANPLVKESQYYGNAIRTPDKPNVNVVCKLKKNKIKNRPLLRRLVVVLVCYEEKLVEV